MGERIPLSAGLSTPESIEIALSIFGNNPYREPNFRLIWSERKNIFFAGEDVPEYFYLEHPAWVLETWLPPEKAAGPESKWNQLQEELAGPYPREGVFFYVQHFPETWNPNSDDVVAIARGVVESRHVEIKLREAAIREGLEKEASDKRKEVAETILESFGSAELGKTTQAASGRPNVFRTADDFGRDVDRERAIPGLPERGGKLIN